MRSHGASIIHSSSSLHGRPGGTDISTGRFRRRALRVLIADDDERIRKVTRKALDAQPGFEVVAVASAADEAIAAAEAAQPDVALLDVSMPGGGGPAAARGISQVSPRTAIVALSAHEQAATVRTMLEAGADGYAVKGTPLSELTGLLLSVVAPERLETEAEVPEAHGGGQDGAIRLLVAEDDPSVLAALAQVADTAPELELVGLAQTPYHAVTLAARHLPDVALVDVRMPGGGGARIAAEIRSCSPGTRIVAFSGHSDRESVLGMIRSGATSYLLKDSPLRDLVDAIVDAHHGASRLADEVSAVVLRELVGRLEGAGEDVDLQRNRRDRIEAVLSGGALRTVFQPIETLADQRSVGYEALARFDGTPPRTPDVWFDEAASVGLGVDLELLAVRRALESLPKLPRDAFLALNVSPGTAVVPALRALLAGRERRVVLEVTEHAPIGDYAEFVEALRELRDAGVRLAVDDCGAGFASLRHVLLLAPDFIKLDIALCRDLKDPMRRAMARALVSFADETGSDVIAEGIETVSDLEALRDLGVEFGQGYLLGKPVELGLPTQA